MVGHLLPNLDFREDGSEFWWGVFSLCLSLSLSLSLCVLSLSLAQQSATREANEQQQQQQQRQQHQERKSYERVCFSDVCLFSTFSEIPQKETRSTLYIIIALLPCFCSSSSLPPLKEESVSEAYSSLRVRTVSFYQKFRKHLRKRTGC